METDDDELFRYHYFYLLGFQGDIKLAFHWHRIYYFTVNIKEKTTNRTIRYCILLRILNKLYHATA